MEKNKKDKLIKEIRLYTKARSGTNITFLDGIRQTLIAKELSKYKVNWKEL